MKREVRFALDVLSGRFPGEGQDGAGQELDWFYLLGFLELNRTAGSFYRGAKEGQVALPTAVERRLSGLHAEQAYRVRYMRRWIEDVGFELDREGLRYSFLKGSVLCNAKLKGTRVYDDGERVSNDIDLLISPSEISRVSAVLKRLGFRQGFWDFGYGRIAELPRSEIISRRMNRGETAPFLTETGNDRVPFIEVDVNFSVDYLPGGQERIVEGILDGSARYDGELGGGIASCDCEHFLLHLILHQYKESVLFSMAERSKESELYKLVDIHRFLTLGLADLGRFRVLTERYGTEKQTAAVLSSVAGLFGTPLPGWLTREEEEPIVLMPGKKRKFVWTAPLGERISSFHRLKYLRELP